MNISWELIVIKTSRHAFHASNGIYSLLQFFLVVYNWSLSFYGVLRTIKNRLGAGKKIFLHLRINLMPLLGYAEI